ncbi:MAG: AAA family ATPase [Clostridia bacterium]|jgi:hypothetical protein
MNKNQIEEFIATVSINGSPEPYGWYSILYKKVSNSIDARDIKVDIIDYLKEIGFKVFRVAREFNTKKYDITKYNKGESVKLTASNSFGDFFMDIRIHETSDKDATGTALCSVDVYYEHDNADSLKYITDILTKFKETKKVGAFAILIKNEFNELDLRDFSTNIPKNIDLEYNYGNNFKKVHEKIIEKLNSKANGLYVFNGDPGTGKSTYIKYLASVLPEKKFVYIPEFMMGMLNQPDVIRLLLDNKNVIMVIEDAEKLIRKREQDDGSSVVSTLLNFTDGILSDIMGIPIILTYNTHSDNIDQALLRKGRLQYKHEFELLDEESSLKILKKHKVSKTKIDALKKDGTIKNKMSLADLFNLFDDIGEEAKKEEPVKTKFGF